MPKLRKKVVDVEGVRFEPDIDDTKDYPSWLFEALQDGTIEPSITRAGNEIAIIHDKVNNHGDLIVNSGDWIIRGVKGELYPCTHDVFLQTYDIIP